MSMGRLLPSILALALLASCCVAPLHARFTQTTCWTGENTECNEQNTRGSWCYVPTSGLTIATTCTGTSADFASVLEVHLAQGLSVAYYSGIDNALLGGGDYPIPSNPGVIRLCMSGRSGDGNPYTLCVNALADNAFGNHPYCQVIRGQENVTDVCRQSWRPMAHRLWFRSLFRGHLLPVPAAPFPPLLTPAAHARFPMLVHCFQSQLLR